MVSSVALIKVEIQADNRLDYSELLLWEDREEPETAKVFSLCNANKDSLFVYVFHGCDNMVNFDSFIIDTVAFSSTKID